jgi:hypothetical protein
LIVFSSGLLCTIEISSGFDGPIITDTNIQNTVLANREGVRERDNGLARIAEIVDRLSFGEGVLRTGPALPELVLGW